MPQDNLSFLTDQAARIEETVYRRRYPDVQYPELTPVETGTFPWITLITHFSSDGSGRPRWFSIRANDIEMVDVTRAKHEVPVESAAVGYDYDEQELNIARTLGIDLTDEKASTARRVAQEFLDEVALRGDSDKGWNGLINQPVTGTTAVGRDDAPLASGGATVSARYWVNKSGVEIAADVNSSLINVHANSKQVEMANTLLLPVKEQSLLSTEPFSSSVNESILSYIQTNNVYTVTTGQPLTIRAVRGLEDAATDGSGGNAVVAGSGRMIAYRRDPEVLRFHLPMDHRFGEPMRPAPYYYVVPGMFRTGGLEVRLPGAMRYMDGISA